MSLLLLYYFIIITYNAFNVYIYIYIYIISMWCQLEDISLLATLKFEYK